ncbi:MAG TPA: hypothetical protein PK634_12165, partial [Kiritimatiellia bacterium]|nr:hypothetical protein [Kiritimatiellia bacterium]
EGCDGLKTGYFKLGGYSMAVTARRGDARVIAVILGSLKREVRDARASELLSQGLADLARRPPPPPPRPAVTAAAEPITAPPEEDEAAPAGRAWKWGLAGLAVLAVAALAIWSRRPRFNR